MGEQGSRWSASAPVRLGVRTVLLLAAVLGGLAVVGALDPVELLLPGQKGAGGTVMVEDFGPERIPDGYSYDGQQYYLAARFFPDVEAAGDVVGGPRFRLMRIVLPALASPGGEGTGVVLLLAAWNIVGVGIAVGSLADLAERYRRPPIIGVAAALALALPLILTTGECLAFGLGFLALSLAHRDRTAWALSVLALAGLTRETALTFGLGIFACWVARRRWWAAAAVPLSALPLALWRWYLEETIGTGPDAPVGILDLLAITDRPAIDQVVTAVVLLLGIYAAVHWRDAVLLWPVALAWLAWFLLYEYDTYDLRALPRVSAPLVALGLAGVASDWLRRREGAERDRSWRREGIAPGRR